MPQTMSFAVVLTSPPGRQALSLAHTEQALTQLSSNCSIAGPSVWLAPQEAWEVAFRAPEDLNISALRGALARAIGAAPIDINIVAGDQAARRKKLLIADMDSTIINQECVDEIATHIGIGNKVSAITERAMNGELDFDAALIERVALLKGMSEAELETIFETRITLMSGAKTLIQTMRKQRVFCALVSGGFKFFTSRIAAQVGFNVTQANALEVSNGKLNGSVAMPILGRQAKLDALNDYMAVLDLEPTAVIAVGDGANDLAMIKAAGLGVAYHAKPIVAAQANATITHGDLTALLYLQGYSKNEFVT